MFAKDLGLLDQVPSELKLIISTHLEYLRPIGEKLFSREEIHTLLCVQDEIVMTFSDAQNCDTRRYSKSESKTIPVALGVRKQTKRMIKCRHSLYNVAYFYNFSHETITNKMLIECLQNRGGPDIKRRTPDIFDFIHPNPHQTRQGINPNVILLDLRSVFVIYKHRFQGIDALISAQLAKGATREFLFRLVGYYRQEEEIIRLENYLVTNINYLATASSCSTTPETGPINTKMLMTVRNKIPIHAKSLAVMIDAMQ